MSITLHTVSADAGKRLDLFVHEHLREYSRARLQSWIKNGFVLVNGAAARAAYLLKGGEHIEISPADLPPLKATAEELPLEILYEDADVIVVNKAAGMVVHAGAGHHEGTLVNALLHHFGQLSTVGGDLRPGIVHRLDRETSGALVVARTDKAHQSLARQFHSRQVEKLYTALVHGTMPQPHGTITKPIARDPVRRTRMTTRLESGRTALTEYTVAEQLPHFTLLDVRIGTGRTHQIRVHLSSFRHPVVGDFLYGAPKTVPGLKAPSRFFLHARHLRFRSPSTGGLIDVTSPLAPELEEWLDEIRSIDL